MDIINSIVAVLVGWADWFWGVPILILIGFGGLYVSIVLGFIQTTKLPYILKQTFGSFFKKKEKGDGISSSSAALAALASSIGASNIVGVPVAIALGGPGAVFWMWVLGILGQATKYVEVALGIMYREKNEDGEYLGGPYYYLKNGFGGSIGKFLGVFFAFFLMLEIVPSIALQAASATNQVLVFGFSEKIIAGVIAAIVAVVCIGGMKRIAQVTDLLVPAMAIIYLLGVLVILIVNIGSVPGAIASIFSTAFTGTAAVGGFAGATVKHALRWGAARGVYSNEAGMGTAPVAHATAEVDHPIRQAMWGVFEVIVDTMIVCTATALAVLTSGAWTTDGASKAGGTLAQIAYNSVFGSFGDIFVAVCVFFFVLSTIIVITFYGEKQAEFLFGKKFSNAWRWIYIVAAFVGGIGIEIKTLYSLTDFMLGIIIIPNMVAVVLLAPRVKKLQEEFFNTPGKYYLADIEAEKNK